MSNRHSSKSSPANQALDAYLNDLLKPSSEPSHIKTQNERKQTKFEDLESSPLDTNKHSITALEQLFESANSEQVKKEVCETQSTIETKSSLFSDHEKALIQAEYQKAVKLNKEKSDLADNSNISNERDLKVALNQSLSDRFQVLFFDIAGVTIAIPLVELGSILKITKISKLSKKPSWFIGLMLKGNDTYNCIDAASWLVPDKYAKKGCDKDDYKFAIQLGKTPYVLCCDNVSNTAELSKQDIKWAEQPQKRKWMAGLLKKEMCALIDGTKMVQEILSHT